ncbi:MAG: winged helix DNA-binding domain-containing protein, partial [Chloroflexi bacterium]|nr:winged helix DNA-binding domain-containing protein [Chloroflexota bacterium]
GTSGSSELWLGSVPWIEIGLEGGLPLKVAARRQLHAELVEAGELLPVEIEGLKGLRYAVASDAALLDQAEREVTAEASAAAGGSSAMPRAGVAFLAPLDPLVWDREFLRALFGFDYLWEVYVPAAKRRWGYYVLPLLYGDRLVGRIEPRIDRKAGTLRILGLWWEDDFDPLADPAFAAAFAEAVRAHLAFGGVTRVAWPPTARHRTFVKAVKPAL